MHHLTWIPGYNINGNETFLPMIEYKPIPKHGCLPINKRIIKTTADEWAIIDSEYKHLFESQSFSTFERNNSFNLKLKTTIIHLCYFDHH